MVPRPDGRHSSRADRPPTAALTAVLGALVVGVLISAPAPAAPPPALAVAGFAATVPPGDPPADPFPIRRIRAQEALLPDLLKQLEPGPLVRLPRAEFESRVRALGRRMAEVRLLPRITDVRLEATLEGGDLVGLAELELVNTTATPRFLPLDPLRLALGRATWADGREAVIAIPPGGGGPAVWVDREGPQTLRFAWSLAGVAELGERRFELRVPAAPTAVMSLRLPPGQVPAASASDVLLTGPFPGTREPGRTEWRFRFGGRPRLDFALRPAVNPGAPAAAALVARYDLTPGQLLGGFEYNLRPSKGTVGEWVFRVDPELRITDVVVNNRAGWVVDPPTTPGGPRTLRITLHQPGAGGKVLISTVAPLMGATRPSPLPGVRPVGANLDEETIEIRLAPGFKPTSWDPGDYRLLDSQILAEQGRSLTLTGTLLPPGAKQGFRRWPTIAIAPTEVEYSSTEQIAWRFDVERAVLSARFMLHIRRGTLFEFALRGPTGYDFGSVSAAQEDLISHAESSAGLTRVEFSRPLNAGESVELSFEFRGPPVVGTDSLPFPAFVPAGASERAGVLALLPGPLWAIEPRPGVGAESAAWLDTIDPPVPSGSTAAYRYRGTSPEGTIAVTGVRPMFSATTSTTVAPIPGGVIGTTVINYRVHDGGLAALLVVESGGIPPQRTWRVAGGGNAIASAVVLPMQELVNPLLHPTGWLGRAAITSADQPMGRVWLVRLARPVTREVLLETTATRMLPAESTADDVRAVTASFSRWVIPGATPEPGGAPPSPADVRPSHPSAWGYSGLYLVTAVRSPGDVVAIFGGTIDVAPGTRLPLKLPAGAELRAASVGGRWLESGGLQTTGEGVVSLPVPGPVRFEVRYRLPARVNGLGDRVRSPDPILPDRSVDPEVRDREVIHRWWIFGSDVLPGWPVRAWNRSSPSELPSFLGDSPAAWTGGLTISRMALEEVWIGTAQLADTLGLGLTAMAIVLAFASARGRQRFPVLLTTGLVVVLGAISLLGPPWWQRAVSIPLGVGLAGLAVTVILRGRREAMPLAAGLLTLTQIDTHAQPSSPALVIVLETEGREVVLAPKSVLDRLSPAPQAQDVVLSASDYAIRVHETGARVTATYTAHALAEGETVLSLPLAEARLEKLLVNGSTAYPAAPRPGVYTVPLAGKGRHVVEATFSVPLGGVGADRELRFGVPECPATRLSADLPGAARQTQAIGRIGRQSLAEGGRVKLEADLGAVRTAHLRWREGAEGMGGSASVKVREGCVWDVTESGAELTACYLTRIEQGTLGSLLINVPAELDTLAVVVRSLDLVGAATLRDWTTGKEEGGYRPLRIDLQAPTSGQLLVVLTCAPREPITRQPTLRFPKPVLPGIPVEPDAAYGLRTRGVSVEDPGRSGVIDYAPDALLRDFGTIFGRQESNAPIRVFRATPGSTPHLRPTLRVATERPTVTQETAWTVGPRRADATGTIHWTARDAPELFEFSLPGVRVLELRGADVASWNQLGARVQVWFRRSSREGEIDWLGTAAVPEGPFTALTPALAALRLATDTVRVRAAAGYALSVERDQGWSELDEPAVARRTTSGEAAPVRVRIAPAERSLKQREPMRAEGASKHSKAQAPRPRALPSPPAPPPIASPAVESPRWVWPVSATVAWVAAGALLALLILRLPRTTWPEQFGLATGMLGAVVLGSGWIGLAGWGVARSVWLLGQLANRPPAQMDRG